MTKDISRPIEAIRKYEEEYDATVIFGHDMDQFMSLIKSTEGFYE